MSNDRVSETNKPPYDQLIACPGCDRIYQRPELAFGQQANCSRCGDVLVTRKAHPVDRSLAATLAGLVFLFACLNLPFLELSRAGLNNQMSVFDAVNVLWFSNMRWLGLVTLAGIVLLPGVRLALLLWVLVRLRLRLATVPSMRAALRWAIYLEPWAMADIFMVGVAVSLVKIGSLAHLSIGPAFWALVGLLVATIVLNLALCKDTLWQRLAPR